MSINLIKEDFSSLSELIKTIDNRPNNYEMRYEHSSSTETRDFTGTDSYEEAINLLKFGYEDPIPQIKEELRKNKLVTTKIYRSLPKPIPRNGIIGFAPNVPNAILGLPESMITVDREIQKKKCMSIIYSFGAPWFIDKDDLIRAGITLVSAINIIELSGIQTCLQLNFMPVTEDVDREIVFPTVKIKDYGERFNLQKICFPMIHTSMFRRVGFKYLETCPFTKLDYSHGYGRVLGVVEKVKAMIEDDKTYIFSSEQIMNDGYNVEKILKETGVLR